MGQPNSKGGGGIDPAAILAIASVMVYHVNGHILKFVGEKAWVTGSCLIWCLHVVIALLAPYAFKRWGDVKEELKKIKCSLPKFFFAVIFNSILQMSINSFWTASVQTIPTQLTVAIFQCSVGVVYILSLLFLGEEFQFKKALGVVLALVGVNLASFFPPVAMASASSHTVSFMQNINYPKGIALATAALAAKVGSQIFCSQMLKGASGDLSFQFSIHQGIAHIYAIAPLMKVLDIAGLPGMSFKADFTWPMIPTMLGAAAASTFVSFGYQTVAVIRSPLFLNRFQSLGVLLSVLVDVIIDKVKPRPAGFLGYLCILLGFTLISGVIGGKKTLPKPVKAAMEAAKEA